MVILPETKEKISAIVSSIHHNLVWHAEDYSVGVFQLNVYFPDEGKSKGVTIQEFQDEDDCMTKCVTSLIRYFMSGKLDPWINRHV